MSESIPPNVEKMLNEEAPIAPVDTGQPLYRVDPTSKVAVSKTYGKLWKSRIDAAQSARKPHIDAGDECIRYYNNSQLDHRDTSRDGRSGNRYFSKRRNNDWSETENIVYANTRAMMPALYTKNPSVELTPTNDDDEEIVNYVQLNEELVNKQANIPHAPGLNFKVHAKQAILNAEIVNLGWLEYGYTERSNSMFGVQEQLAELTKQLEDAKDTKTIREVEGKLMALEEQLAVSSPPGSFVCFKPMHDVVTDPAASLPDFSDCNWQAVREIYPTEYLNARYGEKDENGQVKSLYEPTHVLVAGESAEDEIKNFKLFKTDAEASEYGYTDKESLAKAHRTQCWRIWDKTTRRVFLYAENKWDWPIWVENDPYGLPGFFPRRAVYFNTSPLGAYARSNVTYYLDQQDGINEIHDEFRRARQDIKENILYDSSFSRETLEKWLKGSGPSAHGVEVPDGKSLRDMILEKPNQMLKALPLFDPARLLSSVDRVSGVSDVMRNVQFKTNTTNKAIESYNSTTALRLDEKIDSIEEAFGDVLYGIAFLNAQFMTQEDVSMILGTKKAEAWKNYDAQTLRSMFTCRAVGGSTQKPTSDAKKQQSVEMAKILSQFAQFAPSVVLETTLKLFDEAFDEFHLPEDWAERIIEESKAALNRGNSTGGVSGEGSSGEAGATSGASGGEMEQIASLIDALPPEAKLALGQVLARGVPVAEAVPEILRAASNNSGQLQ